MCAAGVFLSEVMSALVIILRHHSNFSTSYMLAQNIALEGSIWAYPHTL